MLRVGMWVCLAWDETLATCNQLISAGS